MNTNLKYVGHILIFLLSALPSEASDLLDSHTVNYTASDGLPSNEVTCITDDDLGMIWFGTKNGMARFDGYEFKLFRSDYQSPLSFKSNSIRMMKKAPDGRLWIVTKKEVAVFDPRTQRLVTVESNREFVNLVSALLVTRSGDVYLGIINGCPLYRYSHGKFVRQNVLKNDVHVTSLYEDRKGNIWIGSRVYGFYKYNVKTRKVCSYYEKLNVKELRVKDFAEDRHGRLWVATWESHGLICVEEPDNEDSKKIRICKISKALSGSQLLVMYKILYEPDEDKLYIAAADGLYIMDCDCDDSLVMSRGKKILNTFEVKTLFRTSGGELWASVLGYGVNRTVRNKLPFTQLLAGVNNKDNIITSLYSVSESAIWMGMRKGVMAEYNFKTGSFKDFQSQNLHRDINVKSNAIMGFVKDVKNSLLWMSMRYDGLYCMDLNSGKAYRLRDKWPDLKISNGIVPKGNGVLYVVNDTFYYVTFDIKRGFVVKPCVNLNKSLNTTDVTSLCNVKGTVWIGTDEGLARMDKSGALRKYNVKNNKLVYNSVSCLYADSRGDVWAGTNGGGLSRYDAKTDEFNVVPSVRPVSDNIIYSIIEDGNHNLWMATGKGVCRMSLGDMNKVRLYTKYDGVGNNQFSPNAVLRLPDSRLLFGGYNGIDCYNPANDRVDTSRSVTAVVDISVMNINISDLQRNNVDSLLPPYTDVLDLKYNQNNIKLTFSALKCLNPMSVSYAYMMQGVDGDWIYVGANHRQVSYNNLNPGKYVFMVKSCNENGLWSPVKTLTIIINPPLWRTKLAYFMFLLMALLMSYVIYRIIRYRVKMQNELRIKQIEYEKSEDVNREKLKFFTNISHELFTPLSVMQCSVESLKMDKTSDTKTLDIMQMNLRRLKRLLQQIMEFRKVESGNLKLKVSRHDIIPFIKNICSENFLPLLDKKKITMDFRCEQDSIMAWFDIDKLDKILYNLLSNALKYNYECGVVVVGLRESNDNGRRQITITVENTGDGIPEKKLPYLFRRFYEGDYRKFHTAGTGIGLSLTKDLVELHHGEISVRSIVGQMTSFTVTLPADKESYTPDEIEELANPANRSNDDESNTVIDENHSDILLVEDDSDLLLVMKKVLGKVYDVHTATNGKEALQYLKSRECADIVITDYVMPEMDGLELCKAIRNDAELNYLPVVMLTAKTQSEFQKLGYDAGADVYLPKPIEMSVLIAQVNTIINNRKKVAEMYLSDKHVSDAEDQKIIMSESDRTFMEKVMAIIEENIKDSEFSNDMLYAKMGSSQSTMYRRLKSLTGLSPNEMIRQARIKKACELLEQGDMRISEIAYAVGFTDPKYFSVIFKKVKGVSPKNYMEKQDE